MEPFRFHVYACVQEKPKDVPCCAASGSAAVLEALTQALAAAGLRDEVQVTTTSCMGTCENGPVLVAYPEGIWYSKVTPHDVPSIVAAHFAGGNALHALARTDFGEMKAQIIEHREKYLAMLREKAAKEAELVATK